LERAMNAGNERQRAFFEKYISEQLEDHQDLLEDLVPKYPPFGKRMLFDNRWYRTIVHKDVTVNTTSAADL
jgi:4-hydroxyacetophenone monooxygenase